MNDQEYTDFTHLQILRDAHQLLSNIHPLRSSVIDYSTYQAIMMKLLYWMDDYSKFITIEEE